jgi:7-cyano-7-deazaguanine reductase
MLTKKKKAVLDNTNIGRHLGKSSSYISVYDATLLVREPRQANRTHLDIEDEDLPFVGSDTWNGYEVTALTNEGLPVSGICKFVYDCSSKYIVESKSVKLYFNSFSMTKLGIIAQDVLRAIEKTASKDISDLLETPVTVRLFSNYDALTDICEVIDEWGHRRVDKCSFITIEDEYSVKGVKIDTYSETPSLLKVIDSEVGSERYHSSLLRSLCRITSQPDTGDVYVYIKGKKTVDPISLLKYIISFRDENHFHEEICEAIYKRLWDLLQPEELVVKCLYARRGGWDINPERASHPRLVHYTLSDASVLHLKTPRQ